MAETGKLRAIDILERATRKGLLRKEIQLGADASMEIHYKPLTLAEEERLREDLGANASANAYALRLLIEKAVWPDGTRMFSKEDLPRLKNNVEKQYAEAAMLVILANEGEEAIDMKSA